MNTFRDLSVGWKLIVILVAAAVGFALWTFCAVTYESMNSPYY